MSELSELLQNAKEVSELISATKEVIETGIWIFPIISRLAYASLGVLGKRSDKLKDKTDIPILIQATQRPVATDVQDYIQHLQKSNKNAKFAPLFVLGIGDDPREGKMLPDDREIWEGLTTDFIKYIHDIQSAYGSLQRYHIFIAGPSVLGFALGTRVGRLYKVSLYNHNPKADTIDAKYFRSIDTDQLRE